MLQHITLFGHAINLYYTFNNIGNVCLFLWIVFHLKEYKQFSTYPRLAEAKLGKKKKGSFIGLLFSFIEAAIIFALVFIPSYQFAHMISSVFLGTKADNYFVNIYFLPIEVILYAILLRVSPFRLTDFTAPGVILALICFKTACFFQGCCYGVESESFGLLNHNTGKTEFPVQLVELACAVIMLIIILVLRRKKERKAGILYPLFMLMYCGSRFVSEFWRADFPAVWGPLKGYHIQCIVGFIEGLILMFIVLKWGEKITNTLEAKNQNFRERCLAKSAEKRGKSKNK